MRHLVFPIAVVLLTHAPIVTAQEIVGGTWQPFGQLSAPAGHAFNDSMYAVPDCDGDGYEDLAMNHYTGHWVTSIKLFDGLDGSFLRELDLSGYVETRTPSYAGDLDQDGVPDFMIGTMRLNKRIQVVSGVDGSLLQTFPYANLYMDSEYYHQKPGGDIDGDGVDDILVGNGHAGSTIHGSGVVYALSGATGTVIHELTGAFVDEAIGSNVLAAGDRDGDGCDEFLVASHGHAYVPHYGYARLYDGRTGQVIWEIPGDSGAYAFGIRTFALADDLNGDTLPDLLVSTFDSTIAYTLHGQQEFRRYPALTLQPVPDLNGDGLDELVEGSHTPSIRDGHTGKTLREDGDGFLVTPTYAFLRRPLVIIERDTGTTTSFDLQYFEPHIGVERTRLRVVPGDSIEVEIDFGSQHGGDHYGLLLSRTGVGPSVFAGIDLPITMDNLAVRSLAGLYPQAFQDPVGVLDGYGRATCTLNLLPLQYAGAVGRELTVAVAAIQQGSLVTTSTALHLTLVP